MLNLVGHRGVAVPQVDGNMPTMPLATTANDLKSGQSIAAAGFPGSATDLPSGFTEPVKLIGRVSNVRSDGTAKVVEASTANLSHGMSGGPGVYSDGEVVGLISTTRLDPPTADPPRSTCGRSTTSGRRSEPPAASRWPAVRWTPCLARRWTTSGTATTAPRYRCTRRC